MTQPLQIHTGHLVVIEALARRQRTDPKHVLDSALRHGLVAMAYQAAVASSQQEAERWIAGHEGQPQPDA